MKYEFLEYLVEEGNEIEAVKNGRDRGGRGRLIKDGDQAYNDLGVVVLSKKDDRAYSSSDTFTRSMRDLLV